MESSHAPWLPFVPPTLALHQPDIAEPVDDVTIDDTVTLFLDVAGFTPLTAALEEHGSDGLEELQALLNSFFGRVDRTIESWGGAVIRYEGDAVVAAFDRESRIDDAIGAASNILDIADEMAAINTLAGLQSIRAKIGIAPGSLRSLLLTQGDRRAIVVAGDALDAAVEAEHRATPGDLIASPDLAVSLESLTAEPMTDGADAHLLVDPPRFMVAPTGEPVGLRTDQVLEPRLILDGVVIERLEQGLAATDFRVVGTLFIGLDRIDRLEALLPAVATMSRIVVDAGGSVLGVASGDKGHKALATVGAPTAVDDIETRALTIANALLQEPSLHLRIGITTAVNLAGRLGGSVRSDYTLLGNGVNMAARLMALAETGSALVDETTASAVGEQFVLSEPMDLDVKGRATPIRVRSLSATNRPLAQPLGTAQTSFVNRDEELAQLSACWHDVGIGTGRVCAISGRAGIGKTRLVQTFVDTTAAGTFWLSLPRHRRSLGISALSPLFRWLLGLAENEAPTNATIGRLLDITGWDQGREQYLRVLLDLDPAPGTTPGPQDTELLRSMVVDLVKQRAEQGSMIIVVDGTSALTGLTRTIVEDIAAASTTLPFMLIVLGREEWKATRDISIALGGLAIGPATELAAALGDAAPAELVAEVGGNPLAIELAAGSESRDLRLTALIHSRIESAGETVANWVREAAVFGEFVPVDAVADAVGAVPREVFTNGLLRTDVSGEWARFDSDLVREVAYESLTGTRRRVLHHQAGSVLEDRLAHDDAVTPAMVADHFSHTDDADRQRISFRRAGDFAAGAFDLEDAVVWYELLLPLLAHSDQADAAISLGNWLTTLGEWDRAEAWFEHTLALDRVNARALTGIAGIKQAQGHHREAIQLLSRAEIEARGTDPHALAEILIRRSDVTWGDRTPAQIDDVIAEMTSLAPIVGDGLLARAQHGAATMQWRMHQNPKVARTLLRQAIALVEASGDRVFLCELQNDLAGTYYAENRLEDALKPLRQSREQAAAIGYRRHEAAALGNEAALLIKLGAARQGLELCRQAVEIQVGLGESRFAIQDLNVAATVYSALGEDAAALTLLEELQQIVAGQYEGIVELQIRHHLARSLFRNGNLDSAAEELDAVNELAAQLGYEVLAEEQAVLEVRIAGETDIDKARDLLSLRFDEPTQLSVYELWRLDRASLAASDAARAILNDAFQRTPTARLARRLRAIGPSGPPNPRVDETAELVDPEVFLSLARQVHDALRRAKVRERA